jgi:ubiquitin carboxyl-terminal hydrolase 5/13
VEAALGHTGGNAERAADWLFSHSDDLDGAIAALSAPATGGGGGGGGGGAGGEAAAGNDGVGEYSLVGFVSHMGRNTACGHYVAHIRKEGKWAIFNDRKVAESEEPPKGHGYLYFYRRNDAA